MEKSHETIFNFEEFIKLKTSCATTCAEHDKSNFFEKDNNKTLTECCEKWSEYYTWMGCEDEVNHKGHPSKP